MPLARHDSGNHAMWQYTSISTHMPLARHDRKDMKEANAQHISTHMPLARHDFGAAEIMHYVGKFLLTCLLRGMTIF